MEKQNTYLHILKYTGMFGGVQGLNILISLVRNKLVAMILGPMGMGTVALFASTAKLVGDATNLGLPMSAVRHISEVFERGDVESTGRMICIFRSWSVLASLLGMLLCVAMSPLLSDWTFSFGNHTLHFVYLSPVVALTTMAAGEAAILKATRRLRSLALLSVLGVVSALVISVPIYWYFGMSGIVPSLVAVAFAQAVITLMFSLRLYPLRLTLRLPMLREGAGFVRLGLAFVAGCVLGSGAEFVIRSYLNNVGQVQAVGLYNAAYMMIFTYAGMIFTAMETDYYPRLSAVPSLGTEFNKVVNTQIEVSLLLIAPMLACFVVFMPILLPMLYSGKFMPVLPMIQVAALSMYARTVFLPIEYISLSRADSVSYLVIEFTSYLILVVLVILGYDHWGLFGTGVAMAVAGFLEFVYVYFYCRIRFGFVLSGAVTRMMCVQLSLGLLAYLCTFIQDDLLYWASGLFFCTLSVAYSFSILRRHTHLAESLRRRFAGKLKW